LHSGVGADFVEDLATRLVIFGGTTRLVSCRLLVTGGCSAVHLPLKGPTVTITIDSNESLADALRVLGAMYDVTVIVAENGTSTPTSTAASGPPSGSRQARVRKSSKKLAAGPQVGANNVDVRTWALENGMTVSNRGRLPARIVAAYRDAHQL
jgi:Lsr2